MYGAFSILNLFLEFLLIYWLKYFSGQEEVRYPSGVMEISFSDGSVKKISSDGSEDIKFPDGTHVVVEANGDRSGH